MTQLGKKRTHPYTGFLFFVFQPPVLVLFLKPEANVADTSSVPFFFRLSGEETAVEWKLCLGFHRNIVRIYAFAVVSLV